MALIDYKAVLFSPLYLVYGVAATLTLADTAATEVALTVIDKTSGVELGPNVDVGTLLPGAIFQIAELTDAGHAASDLAEAEITFNGSTWRIAGHYPKPVPSGESSGELVLVLEGA